MSNVPAAAAPDVHFGLTNRFDVTVDGFPLGRWAKCDGLAVTFDLLAYKPLGQNGYLPVLPNRLIYPNITLTRAITTEDAPLVIQWLAQMAGQDTGSTAEITLLDSHKTKVTSWKLKGVYPTKWKGPTFDAGSHNIATESLELAHEGFLDV